MKSFLLAFILLAASTSFLFAQSRVSIAPTYWFSYGTYAYQLLPNGSTADLDLSGHDIGSSAGLTVRYHFTPHWDVSVGLLHNWNSSRSNDSYNLYGNKPFLSKAFQLPVLANYRLTAQRLSPYFSAGTSLVKSTTFNEAPTKVNGVIGVGLAYQIHSGLSALLQPTASYQFYKPADELYFRYTKHQSYSLGIQAQLIWHF